MLYGPLPPGLINLPFQLFSVARHFKLQGLLFTNILIPNIWSHTDKFRHEVFTLSGI